MRTSTLLISALIVLCCSSCGIQKRVYQKGIYVEWGNSFFVRTAKVKPASISSTLNDQLHSGKKAKTVANSKDERRMDDAIFTFVCGILSLAPAVGILFGGFAILSYFTTKKKIKANPEQYRGEKLNRIGFILSIIGVTLNLIYMTVVLVSFQNFSMSNLTLNF